MERNNINNFNYISVENLDILYNDITNYFNDIHKINILNLNLKIKEILFENMKLIYGTKFASSLQTKELNIITLKNIKEILEKEVSKHNITNNDKSRNVDIINRENTIYNRTNNDNKVMNNLSNGTYNNVNNKNISKEYDNLLNERGSIQKKNNLGRLESESIKNETPEKLQKNMEQLMAERDNLLNTENTNTNQNTNPIDNINSISNISPIDSNISIDNISPIDSNIPINNISPIDTNQDLEAYKLSDIDSSPYLNETITEELINLNKNFPSTKKQIIILSSSKRDNTEYPNPYKYVIDLKKPIINIVSIKLLNVFMNIRKVKNNINYLLLNINDFNIITSNNENINNKFACIFDNKIYNEKIEFNNPIIIDKFEITFTDKNNKISIFKNDKNNTNNTNDNIIELEIEYF